MITRSKVVELSGKKFEIRRLPADTGSFIFMRMLGISMRSVAQSRESEHVAKERAEPTEATPISGEMRVRALSFAVFSGDIAFDDFKFIQAACMKSVSKFNAEDMPIPIMTDNGLWTPAGEDIVANVGLLTRLTTEVLIFSFSDFFDESGPGL